MLGSKTVISKSMVKDTISGKSFIKISIFKNLETLIRNTETTSRLKTCSEQPDRTHRPLDDRRVVCPETPIQPETVGTTPIHALSSKPRHDLL